MAKNLYPAVDNKDSNFEGDWDDTCQYCKRSHREHINPNLPIPNYKHRMPCEEQKAAIRANHNRQVCTVKGIIFVGWVLIPLIIAILGFTSPVVGGILLAISVFKIGVAAIKHIGNPDKWIPGYTEKVKKERDMEHYYYHCEKQPEAFKRLKHGNFRIEDDRA